MWLDNKFYVNRKEFIAWSEGILLERTDSRTILVPNEPECIEGEKLLELGKQVYLTQGGKTVSYMQKIDGCFEEHDIKKEGTNG